MSNLNQFKTKLNEDVVKAEACLMCETMLPDAVDGVLSDAEQRLFDKHVAGCMVCAEELAEAQRGAAWLTMLKDHAPEPPPALLNRILAETTGAQSAYVQRESPADARRFVPPAVVAPGFAVPAFAEPKRLVNPLPGLFARLREKIVGAFSLADAHNPFQPRLAMTAAMAFFSVALTLNMTGVKLSSFSAANLKPSALRRTIADTGASALRSLHGTRVVNEFESKLEDLRDAGGQR